MFYRMIKKPFFGRYQKPWKWPQSVPRETWENVEIASNSGAKLTALYGAAGLRESKGTVVCAHPMGLAAKGFYLKGGHADALRAHGYNVVLFDFNGFGESGEGSFHYPKDVVAAGNWAKSRHPEHHIGLLGVSFGAAWGICALADPDHPFTSAVFECPFTTLEEYWVRYKSAYATLKLISWLRPSLALALRPIEKIKDVGSIKSMLFIYGSSDDVTPPAMGDRFLDAYRGTNPDRDAQIWLVDDARHTHAFETREEEYSHKLIGCFDAMVA